MRTCLMLIFVKVLKYLSHFHFLSVLLTHPSVINLFDLKYDFT